MINQLKKTICDNLLKMRSERNYSQRYVGQILSVSQPAYKKMEDGKTFINAGQLSILADFYRVPLEAFYKKIMDFTVDSYKTREQYEQLNEQLRNANMLLDVYRKRIAELEEKAAGEDREKRGFIRQYGY